MIATAAKETLIPFTACSHVVNSDQRLRTHSITVAKPADSHQRHVQFGRISSVPAPGFSVGRQSYSNQTA
jgi:hypothetical protein